MLDVTRVLFCLTFGNWTLLFWRCWECQEHIHGDRYAGTDEKVRDVSKVVVSC